MKTRKLAAVSAITIAALGLAAGTAYADPAPAANDTLKVQLAPSINYTALNDGRSAVITTDIGSLAVSDGKFQIKDADGTIVGGVPLLLGIDEFSVPVDAKVEGNTATLTPRIDKAVYHDVALPFQDSAPWKTPYEREQAAWARFTQTVAVGAAIGVILGAVTAAGLGCAAGVAVASLPAAAGATVTAPTIIGPLASLAVLGIPAAVLGCVGGAAVFAPIGTLVGAIAVAGPVAIAAGIQYFTTINEPFKAPAPAK